MDSKNKSSDPKQTAENTEQSKLPTFLNYPPSEDIYVQGHKESEIDPEDILRNKDSLPIQIKEKPNQKDFATDVSGSDLDVPGSELDDEQEETGNEDEENNYYSLGGENHNNLEEDNN